MSSKIESPKIHDLFSFFDTDLDCLQEHILLLFSKQPRIIGKTRLQKLIFLMNQEIFNTAQFDFEAYKFGPYSSKLLSAMDELMELGLIKEAVNEYCEPDRYVTEYEISSDGLDRADQLIQKINPTKLVEIEEMVHQHGYNEIDSILHHVYVNYPDFTENSIIKDNVLFQQ
ncbi:MAG: hypothetical protein GPJ54_00625 [Candidatus Heimdallarchaeota archaeon]|nr:hypothetical protein [Candidatus Heimdallarchaeota archaeon]